MRSLLRKCVTCKKVAGKPYAAPDPPMPVPIPESRRFTFACVVSRAIHLEIVCDFTLQCFLQAFRRFISWRSLPRLMLSNNASTYQASAEELQALFSSAALAEDLARRGVKWHFIPKRAPWFGGFWERLIGLSKSTLKKCLVELMPPWKASKP